MKAGKSPALAVHEACEGTEGMRHLVACELGKRGAAVRKQHLQELHAPVVGHTPPRRYGNHTEKEIRRYQASRPDLYG